MTSPLSPGAARRLRAVHDTDRAEPSRAGTRLLAAPVVLGLRSRTRPASVESHDRDRHLEEFGPRPSAAGSHGDELVELVQAVALTGRGGGHFPVASKWRAALAAGGGGTVVANGAEGEPASAKDAVLLQTRPHLVLDGLALVAQTVGAAEGVVWLHEGDHATHQVVVRALAERRAAGENEPVRVVLAPDHYLSGESSAVVNGLSGHPVLPSLARAHATTSGVGGRPTVIHNAETLARVALVARAGAAEVGPGSSLVTVIGPHQRAVVEVPAGETFAGLLAASGVVAAIPSAVLVGGYGGNWLTWHELAAAEVSERSLRRLGASLGAGVVAPLPPGACGIAQTAHVVRYLGESGARQCGPCVFGLPAIGDLVGALASGRASKGDLRLLGRYTDEVDGRGACHHPDGAVRLVRTALRAFAADVADHLAGRPCAGHSAGPVVPLPRAA